MPSNGRRDLIRRLNVNRITNLVNGIVVSQFYGTCMHGQLAYRLENDKSRGHSKGRLYCMEYPCSTVCSLSKKKKNTSVHHFYSILRLFRQALTYTVRYLTSLDKAKPVVSSLSA